MRTEISPEPALLGFLRQSPLHGYDLYKQVMGQLGPVWHLGQSQMYAILKDYEQRGWIRSAMEPQAGRPARKVLRLTPKGSKAFDSWMEQSSHGLREFRVDFFTRLFFAQQGGASAVKRLLARQITETQRELDHLRATDPDSQTPSFARLVHHFREEQLQGVLEWLEHVQASKLVQSSPTGSAPGRPDGKTSPSRRRARASG